MFRRAKKRAKDQCVPFTITYADMVMPDKCPVLGIPLKCGVGKPTASSPTLDKIRPHLGYVPGNVAVISSRANALKSNASPDEVYALAEWLKENA